MRSVTLGFAVLGLALPAGASEEPTAAESVLLGTETNELGEVVRYSFHGADGKWLRPIRMTNGSRQRMTQVPSGYHELYVRVERLGPLLNTKSKQPGRTGLSYNELSRRNVWWARATVGASLESGHTYEIRGRFLPGEDMGIYSIVDAETGDPVSEAFELIFVAGVPRREPWSPPRARS